MTIRQKLSQIAVVFALSIAPVSALHAKPLVITGRAAEALHCAAVLYMVAEELYRAGYLNRSDYNWAQNAAVQMLAHVPGTQAQKVDAMGQKFYRLTASMSQSQLLNEFDIRAKRCQAQFM